MNEPDLSVRLTKEFRASKELMFAVETESSHVRHTIAPYGERVDVCEIDLQLPELPSCKYGLQLLHGTIFHIDMFHVCSLLLDLLECDLCLL